MAVTHIAVAEDDPIALAFLCEALAGAGREVVGVATGAELAVRLAHGEPADLVVTDLSMPWMSGLQAIEAARAAGITTPFLLVTGVELPALEERAAHFRAVRVLRKPVSLGELRRCADELLSLAR